MNIFFLDEDPETAAKMHCDKHVVKMVLETAQILSTVHHAHGSPVTYKATHANHPCVVWAGASGHHYGWLHSLGVCLSYEYTFRYGKVHKCHALLAGELCLPPKKLLEKPLIWNDPPKCVPDEFKVKSVVRSYRNYYAEAKSAIAVWTKRKAPAFMEVV